MSKEELKINPKLPYIYPIINGKWNNQVLPNSTMWRNSILFLHQGLDRQNNRKKPTKVEFLEKGVV